MVFASHIHLSSVQSAGWLMISSWVILKSLILFLVCPQSSPGLRRAGKSNTVGSNTADELSTPTFPPAKRRKRSMVDVDFCGGFMVLEGCRNEGWALMKSTRVRKHRRLWGFLRGWDFLGDFLGLLCGFSFFYYFGLFGVVGVFFLHNNPHPIHQNPGQ